MKISEATPEILRLINNKNDSQYILMWVKEVLKSIQRLGRWNYTIKHQIRANDTSNKYVALPTDCVEIIEPIFLNTAVAGTSSWAVASGVWDFDNVNQLESQNNDFSITSFGFTPTSRWNSVSGALWLSYYRSLTLPSSLTDSTELDIPDAFAYPIIVYGAAEKGLILEDDYDRLNEVRAGFARGLQDLKEWDARRGSSNGVIRLRSQTWSNGTGPRLPSNYSL